VCVTRTYTSFLFEKDYYFIIFINSLLANEYDCQWKRKTGLALVSECRQS
jgi:hypothetical protein